jgi:uncharacterized protein with ParB-like and HNH nuclease domain
MATTEHVGLNVSKKSISALFNDEQNSKFIIPDFQRPYKWDFEKCETLWKDIEDFFTSESDTDYFLGTIVYYINNKNREIIDGQQRITSFFLMLRAFYSKLENMKNEDRNIIGLKNRLASCIWDVDDVSGEITDKTKIHIESLAAIEEDNETFHKILETGESDKDKIDNYSVNYRFFKSNAMITQKESRSSGENYVLLY